MSSDGGGIRLWRDITDEFSFLDEHLEYHDGPLEGFLRSSSTGDLFAFRISFIIADRLWHWVLLPVSSTETGLEKIFTAARTAPPDRWLSIVEDRRRGDPQLSAVWMTGRIHG